MKTIKLFFTTCFLVLAFSLRVNAQMPAVAPPAFPTVPVTPSTPNFPNTLPAENFGNNLPDYYLQSGGISLSGENTFYDAIRAYNGSEFDTTYSWQTAELMNLRSENWLSTSLWDSNGNMVNPDNVSIALGSNDAVTVQFLYDNTTGEILNIGDTYAGSTSTVQGSGTQTLFESIAEVLSYFTITSTKPCAIYNPNELALSEINELYDVGTSLYQYDSLHDIGIFCPVVEAGQVAYRFNGTYATVYFNDSAGVTWWNNWEGGGGWQNVKPQTGNFYLDGEYYRYCLPPAGFTWGYENSTLKLPTKSVNEELENKVVRYTPVEPYEMPEYVSQDKTLFQPQNKTVEVNPEYDPEGDTSPSNYPVSISMSTPDFAPTFNYYTTINNYYNSPQIEEEETLQPEDINNNMPILSNLQKRFPFSIPWDINNMLKTLQASREAPHFEWHITFPVINYTWDCSIDLAMYNDSAALFRKLFLILFVVGLAVYSYSHHFGS